MARDVTVLGNQDALFGIQEDEDGLITQVVNSTLGADKKEVRDRSGKVVSVAHYNKTTSFSIEGVGTAGTAAVGAALAVAATGDAAENLPAAGALVIVDEISINAQNEDFEKTSISATAYEGITGS